jgi:hypothetical protein
VFTDEISSQRGELLLSIVSPTEFVRQVPAFCKVRYLETITEPNQNARVTVGFSDRQEPENRHQLLRARGPRPRSCRSSNNNDECSLAQFDGHVTDPRSLGNDRTVSLFQSDLKGGLDLTTSAVGLGRLVNPD